eukprot:947632_1
MSGPEVSEMDEAHPVPPRVTVVKRRSSRRSPTLKSSHSSPSPKSSSRSTSRVQSDTHSRSITPRARARKNKRERTQSQRRNSNVTKLSLSKMTEMVRENRPPLSARDPQFDKWTGRFRIPTPSPSKSRIDLQLDSGPGFKLASGTVSMSPRRHKSKRNIMRSEALGELGSLTYRENDCSAVLKAASSTQPPLGRSDESDNIDRLLSTWALMKAEKQQEHLETLAKISRITDHLKGAGQAYNGKVIDDNILVKGSAKQLEYTYFKTFVPSGSPFFRLELKPLEGQPELYVSQSETYPSNSAFDWKAVEYGNRVLHVDGRTPGTKKFETNMTYYISIYGDTACNFALKAACRPEKLGRKFDKNQADSSVGTYRSIRSRIQSKIKKLKENSSEQEKFKKRVEEIRKHQEARLFAHSQGGRNIIAENRARVGKVNLRREHHAQWERTHRERLERAWTEKELFQESAYSRVLELADKRESQRMESQKRKANLVKLKSLGPAQKRWMMWMVIIVRHKYSTKCLVVNRTTQLFHARRIRAVVIIQKFMRACQKRRSRTQALRFLSSFKSLVEVCLLNYRIVKRDRAADTIVHFLEVLSGTEGLSTVMKGFRRKVVLLQRVCRTWSAIRKARLRMWSIQVDEALIEIKLEYSKSGRRYTAPPSGLSDTLLRETMAEHMSQTRASQAAWVQAMADYKKKKQLEDAKRIVMASGGKEIPTSMLVMPLRPHVSAVLSQEEVARVTDLTLKRVKMHERAKKKTAREVEETMAELRAKRR